MKRLIALTCFLCFSLLAKGQECPPGHEMRNVKCGDKIVSKCVPVNLTCTKCWAVVNPPCPGFKTEGVGFYSSYAKALEVAQRDAAKNYQNCIGPNPKIFKIYLADGGQCSQKPPAPPKPAGATNPTPNKNAPAKAPAQNGQPKLVLNSPPSPSPSSQDLEIAHQEEQERLDNIRRAEEERQAALRQSNVNNIVEALTGANNSLATAGERLRSGLKPGGAVVPGQAIRFQGAPGEQGGAAATVTQAINMDELEEGSSFTPVLKTGLAVARSVVKDPLDPRFDPVYFVADAAKVAAESNEYTKFVSKVPTESLVSGYKYSTRAWQVGQAMLNENGGEAVTKILTFEKVFANRAIGEYVSNNAKAIVRNGEKTLDMTSSIDNFFDADNPYAYLKSEEAFDNYHKTYGAMMLNTITPVRAGFIMYEEGRQLPQRAANTPVGQQTTRIYKYLRTKKKKIKSHYTFETTSDDATD